MPKRREQRAVEALGNARAPTYVREAILAYPLDELPRDSVLLKHAKAVLYAITRDAESPGDQIKAALGLVDACRRAPASVDDGLDRLDNDALNALAVRAKSAIEGNGTDMPGADGRGFAGYGS